MINFTLRMLHFVQIGYKLDKCDAPHADFI